MDLRRHILFSSPVAILSRFSNWQPAILLVDWDDIGQTSSLVERRPFIEKGMQYVGGLPFPHPFVVLELLSASLSIPLIILTFHL